MILASVIVPTYNRSDVIQKSLDSWTKQSIPESYFEVIVVDNNSKDYSADIIKSFVSGFANIIYLFEGEKGSTHARHAGAKIARGEILIFCDDDGLFNTNCIESILDVYKMKPEVAAVAGKIEIQWDDVAPDWIEPYLFMLGKLDYGNEICYGHDLYLNGGLFSIKKDVFNELGGFNPDLVGDYLVGDGDTGLVKKLWKAGMLIGWTPFAVMKHLQFVNKQGTEKDMGRRFYNTGISNSYGFFRDNDFKFNLRVIIYYVKSMLIFLKKWFEMLFSNRDKRRSFFSMMQKKGEIVFFLNLRYSRVRNEIFNNGAI